MREVKKDLLALSKLYDEQEKHVLAPRAKNSKIFEGDFLILQNLSFCIFVAFFQQAKPFYYFPPCKCAVPSSQE